MSLLNNASAGEYAGLTVILNDAPYIEMFIITLVANARYLLMSCALSQRFSPNTPFYHRLLIGYDITDELFSALVSRQSSVDPTYSYGIMAVIIPSWAIGTALGAVIGNLLPVSASSAFSVALYGMFISSFIPPAHSQKPVALCVILGFSTNYLTSVLPIISKISPGMRIIFLTITISAFIGARFPISKNK